MDVNDSKPSLLGLHQDLLVKVLLQLEPRDLQSVSCSCKALALTDSPLWQSLFFHKWDVPRGSHLNYKKLYFRREQLLIYLESVCGRLKPHEEPSLQTLHDGRRVVGAGRFAALSPRLVEVVLSAMSVEKTTVTLLKHQVLSLAQLVVYVVFEEAVATGNLTNPNLLLITELSEALMWRLGGPAGTCAAAPGTEQHKLYQDSTSLALVLLRKREGSNAATVLQSDELRVAAARLLAAQGMVRQGYMPDAIRNGPVSGWPSPSASSDDSSGSSMAASGTSKRDKRGKLLKNHTRDIRRDTIGGGGQMEAGLLGRWMTKTSKQNATAGQKVAKNLARLSPKSLLTMLKKNAGLQPLPIAAGGETGPLEMMTGKWLFHNFSANYFEAGSPVTPFEIIPRVISGSMQLQVDKNGQILGTAGDVLGGMHIKGQVQKFRHALWGSQQSLAKKSSSPDLERQSQTLPKEAAKSKPWQLARKSAPQPSSEAACSGSSNQDDASRTSLARVSFVAHVLRIRQHPTALPTYYRATVQYHGHVTAFGMSGVWSLDEPQQQEGVWSMYPIHKKAQQSFTRSAGRAETGESGQSAGWDLYQLQ